MCAHKQEGLIRFGNRQLLRRALQHSYLPVILSTSHDRVVDDLGAVGVDHGVALQNLRFDAGGVFQLNGRAVNGVENGFNLVAAVQDASRQTERPLGPDSLCA